MGLVVVGFGLLDITGWFLVLAYVAPKFFNVFIDLTTITVVMLCFGMGASSQALFARVGGGIFTKAADVGADLVGKVEAGIPEDDPRNPATIADNVGDNVGDVAGMGADLYESYCGSILATAALGVAAASALKLDVAGAMRFLAAPMVLAGVGIILSILGIFMVRTKEGATMKNLLRALLTGVMGSSVLIAIAAAVVCNYLFGPLSAVSGWGIWGSIIAGLAAGLVIGQATEFYTSYEYKPTQGVAENAETGPATVIIAGIAEGMKSAWVALATIVVAIMLAFGLAGGFTEFTLGLYGVGIAAVGMLATLGITLATDAYGPIADNAGGNAEMTGQDPEVRRRTDALDSLGNTTAATGKGFAIGSAALTALALLAAYVEEVRVGQDRQAEAYVRVHEVADLGVDEAVYIGHNKLAGRDANGQVFAYMAMDGREVLSDMSVGERIAGLSKEDDRHVRLYSASDEQLRLVAAPKASMAQYMAFYDVTLMNPRVLCGVFCGVLLAFVFSALTMKAVGRAANRMVLEVRRQFREIAGIMEGTGKPDYARCVAISTAGAQREMIFPSLMALVVPVLVGLVFGVGGVMGLLVGGLGAGFALAIFMANAGGAWDNAKKWIESGALGGKGSDNHKAAVVGDTVGDPFKDTSGPSLNILIKLMSMVSVVFAGLIVKFAPIVAQWLGMR
jgi:Na+/H+-translocating membrane pyrophosphatase